MLIYTLFGDAHAAEDVYQETMLTVWEKREELPEGPKLEAWIVTTAKNKMLNHITKKSNQHHGELDETLSNQVVAAGADSWIDDLVEIEAISSLSSVDRQILILVIVYEFSCNEAAQILGIKPATARQRLKRAQANARKLTFDHTGSVPPRQRQDENGGDIGVSATQDESPPAGA